MAIISDEDIIAAPGTPLGYAAIGIIRLSGSGAVELAEGLFQPQLQGLKLTRAPERVMNLGHICGASDEPLDEVLVVVMRGPHSYTRQDVVEIHCHGGLVAMSRILERTLRAGARMAEPGEFTRRAWLNGRLDLAQAEAVIDLIRARSGDGMDQALRQLDGSLSSLVRELREQLRMLMAEVEADIDFPEEMSDQDGHLLGQALPVLLSSVEELLQTAKYGRIYREGLAVVLLGKPNTGKSTLLNSLLGTERALVTEIPGTTRDLIEEAVSIRGIPLRLIDTAGIRGQAGVVESLGIDRAKTAVAQADLVLAVFDAGKPIEPEDQTVLQLIAKQDSLLLLNKIDLKQRLLSKEQLAMLAPGHSVLEISAKLGKGKSELEQAVVDLVGGGIAAAAPAMITRARHQNALQRVRNALNDAEGGLEDGATMDCIAVDLWEAWAALGEILGDAVPEEIIDTIFKEFCIGK
ncbi:MAG: tRNA uridine-5-carboxymethylaminomethyl(34) synthesis GTPase MnmE [Thermacetogeniaceae bacterium]